MSAATWPMHSSRMTNAVSISTSVTVSRGQSVIMLPIVSLKLSLQSNQSTNAPMYPMYYESFYGWREIRLTNTTNPVDKSACCREAKSSSTDSACQTRQTQRLSTTTNAPAFERRVYDCLGGVESLNIQCSRRDGMIEFVKPIASNTVTASDHFQHAVHQCCRPSLLRGTVVWVHGPSERPQQVTIGCKGNGPGPWCRGL